MSSEEKFSSEKEVDELKISLDQPIDLAVLAVKKVAVRCKIVATGEPITFRKTRFEVPGEILTVKPSKVWQYRDTHYVAGEVESKRLDIDALNLEPLLLKNEWTWNPEKEYPGDPGEPLDHYCEPIIQFGSRRSYEMEQVLPGEDPEDWNSDPILEAADYHECGDYDEAFKIMENILTTDLRCLDAHAHLGNWSFYTANDSQTWAIDKAKRHYGVGVRIGELSLPEKFNGLLPWNRINNRPFLRCLNGYGLCLWRLGHKEEARKIFTQMLWFNPMDNQGIRFLLADIDNGQTWSESQSCSK